MTLYKTGVFLLFFFLLGCVSENTVSKEELVIQSAADYAVASLLFEKDLSGNASYNIRKNAFVVIAFDKTVSPSAYNDVVNALRSSKAISGVRAEQEGVEICPLR